MREPTTELGCLMERRTRTLDALFGRRCLVRYRVEETCLWMWVNGRMMRRADGFDKFKGHIYREAVGR
jgi:hypothetical protein